jgi:hypothetical protein
VQLNLASTFDLGDMSSADSNWRKLLAALNTAGKFVNLNLTDCTMSGGPEFNPSYIVSTGKAMIAAITLPTVATSINDAYSVAQPAFLNFNNLRSLSGTGLTRIGDYAFYSRTSLTTVTMPLVTEIGTSAFENCTSLTTVTMPLVITIGQNAFASCTNLALTSLPSGLTTIDFGAFQQCTSLVQITMPASLTSIGMSAFDRCMSLTTVTFATGSNITSSNFADYAFVEGSIGTGGNTLKAAYLAVGGGAGTYTRAAGGDTWAKP